MTTDWVVAVDPGKTYGVAVWRPAVYEGNWVLEHVSVEEGLPHRLSRFTPYCPKLIVEGTSFGPSNTHIQRCVGRLEGVFGVEALKVSVQAWRSAQFGKVGKVKWKQLALETYYQRGWGKVRELKRKEHHAAEATLLGEAFVLGKIPEGKVKRG